MSTWPTLADGEVVVEKDISHTNVDYEEKHIKDNSNLPWLMCTVYQLILVMLGVVIVTGATINRQSELLAFAIEGYAAYLVTVALVFLLYVHCYLLRQTNSQVRVPDKILSSESNTAGKSSNRGKHHDSTTPVHPPKPEQGSTVPAIMYCDGVNIYLRLGALAFCVGVVVLNSFSVAFHIINWSHKIWNILHFSGIIQRMVFIFFQTYFLFTCHGIVINKHTVFVQFGLKHMVACNLCIWYYLLMREASGSFFQTPAGEGFTNITVTNATGTLVSPGFKNGTYAGVTMAHIMDVAARYLFPLAIEYCLIAAVTLYKINDNVGKFQATMFETIAKSSPHRASSSNGSLGLFFGIFVVLISLISQSAFIILTESFKLSRIPLLMFYSTKLFILLVAFFGSIFGFLQLNQLRISDAEDPTVDSAFLLVSFFIGGLYNVFQVISAMSNVASFGWIAIFALAVGFLYLIQMVSQSMFIIDGLGRCIGTDSQARTKPGRGAVMLLLLCNLSLWLIHTTEQAEMKRYPLHSTFYGSVAWSFIRHGCMPMLIFYRFHSTVCLSCISEFAYKKHKLH